MLYDLSYYSARARGFSGFYLSNYQQNFSLRYWPVQNLIVIVVNICTYWDVISVNIFF